MPMKEKTTMKRTLITIALTTVVVLTLVGVVSALFTARVGNTFSNVSRSLDTGYGGGQPELYAPAMEMPAAAPAPMASDMVTGQTAVSNTAPLADVERKIIKNASLSIVVTDPVQSMDNITKLAEQIGGYVVSSNVYQSNYGPNNVTVPEGSISIRIPAEKLNDALDQIKNSSVEVQSENVSGQDVTDQYVDLQSRLTAKQAAEKKLLQFLDQANNTEDTLSVYTQLQQVQSDIEVLKGQIKYIDQSAALSSLSVTLIAEAGVQPIEIGGWKLQGTAKEAVQELINFTQGFTRFLIRFVLYTLPALILIAIPLYLIFIGGRALFRRFRKPKAVVEVKEAEK
jgi:uncharacterized lipoprotein YehR (DUF1307 family)